jgi:hypothetical protein
MRSYIVLLLSIALIFSSFANAQGYRLSGVVKSNDSTGFLNGAAVSIQSLSDSTGRLTTLTDSLGRFRFEGLRSDSFRITFNSLGSTLTTQLVKIDSSDVDLGVIVLTAGDDVLSSVTVTASAAPVVQRGDTVQFSASQYKVNRDATAEELAKKIPGITVENGQVKANGENVQKVTIDGRELFGDDATAALRNLPAEIIDKIQVFDRLSDQAQFTGFDDGSSTKGINIVTKANMRNGQFGRLFAGYGTDSRYQAGGNATFLNDNRKISIVGNFNNVNQQNFASQDLLGVTSSGSQRGGGGGGGAPRGGGGGGGNPRGGGGGQGGGNFGNSNNFLVGQQNGINKTNAIGINYADNWGKKVNVSASYFFNNTDNNTDERVNREYYLKTIQNYEQSSVSSSRNNNHRFNMRFEYTIDSSNQLIITPSLSFQDNRSFRIIGTRFIDNSTGATASRTVNTNNSTRSGNNLNNTILWRHSFAKPRRTLSVNLNTSYNNREGDVFNTLLDTLFNGSGGFTDSIARRFTDQHNNGFQVSTNIAYTEPIGRFGQLQFNYNPSWSKNKANQEAFGFDENTNKYSDFDPALSSRFENTYTTQNAGISYRYGNRDNQFSLGMNYQGANLKSDQLFPRPLQVDQTFQNILPNAMLRLKLSQRSNIRLFYRANTNQPSVTQLQDVYDITNLPFVTAGNPELKQQYSHTMNGRYTFSHTGKGILLVGNVFMQTASNYITSATFVPQSDSALTTDVTLRAGQQLTKPVNVDGYWNLRSFLTFAMPVKFIKSSLNFNGGISFSKLPGIINNVYNESKNTTYSAGLVIASNISQYVDFTASYSANFNTVKNQLQEDLNNNYFSHLASLQMNLLTKNGWFFQNDLNNQLYSGLSDGFDQSYFIWNMALGKKFLANQQGELKLSVFDLLKQNQSINVNPTETYFEKIQNQVLQQYFMLTFTYNLRNFGTATARSNNRTRGGGNTDRN